MIERVLDLSRLPDKYKTGARGHYTWWRAICQCGIETFVTTGQVKRVKSLSCGCQKPNPASPFLFGPRDTNINAYITKTKLRAKKKGIEWLLSRRDVIDMIFKPCHYCGIQPNRPIYNVYQKARHKNVTSEKAKRRQQDGIFNAHGIDRIDSNLNYSLDNCVPCCQDCNYGKHTKTLSGFKEWINRVWTHQNKS